MRRSRLTWLLLFLFTTSAGAEPGNSGALSPFGWQFLRTTSRGGQSEGPAVTLLTEPGLPWKRINEPGLSLKEKDRRAILAMAGTYRASFEFVETATFTPGLEVASPYRSWGVEKVYVLEDVDDRIVLQHVLIAVNPSTDEAVAVKHWRQDWQWQYERITRLGTDR